MSLLARALLALLFTTLPFPSLAAEDYPEFIDVTADLSVSAAGKIVKLEFVDDLSDELEQFLRARVGTWAVEPARRGGRAVGGDTSLYLRLSIEPAGDDVIVRVAKASTGPRTAEIVPPRYPSHALRRGRQAIVLATVDVRADGTVGAVSARLIAGKGSEKPFIHAAERSLRAWRFVPERVDGVPVATQVRIPLTFHLGGLPRLEMPVLDAGLLLEPNVLVAESEFELASDVVGRKL